MSNKLMMEDFQKYGTNWHIGNIPLWDRIEAHTAECVDEAIAKLKKTHFEIGEVVEYLNDKRWRKATVELFDSGLLTGKYFVRRPVKTRPMTDKELKRLVVTSLGDDVATLPYSRPTLEAMAKDLGISTEVQDAD